MQTLQQPTISAEEPLPPLGDLAAAYRELELDIDRRKKEFKNSLKEDEDTLESLQEMVLESFRQQKIKNVTVEGETAETTGTLYRIIKVAAKVADAEAFFKWVLRTKRTDFLHARATDTVVMEYLEKERKLPPGLSTYSKIGLGFRKK